MKNLHGRVSIIKVDGADVVALGAENVARADVARADVVVAAVAEDNLGKNLRLYAENGALINPVVAVVANKLI